MRKQLTYIAPLRAGIVLATLYGLLSLLLVPFFLLGGLLGAKSGGPVPFVFGVGFAVMLPVMYAVLGFIGGLLSAAVYNLIAKMTGGFEFEVRDLGAAGS